MIRPKRSVYPFVYVCSVLLSFCWFVQALPAVRAAEEFTGKFEPQLAANEEDLEQVILKPFDPSSLQLAQPLERGATVTAARLLHPPSEKQAMWVLLVEPRAGEPYVYVDGNLDNALSAAERYPLKRGEDDNPYLLETTVQVALKEGVFQTYPVFLRYFRTIKTEEMQEGDRLLQQSSEAFARGFVEIAGKRTLVQYGYNPRTRKLSPTAGKVGIDCDGDGVIDLDRFSPEAAEAREETIVFRVGNSYVSTKRVDLEKNVIVLRTHEAKDYKRIEVRVGGEMPDFQFTDFQNKKRRLSEFRGKYVLLDFWGTWCGPCRREMPYLKAAYRHFNPRGLEILGMNTDEAEILPSVREWLDKNGLVWTQARRESILDTIKSLRIHSYPTTMLLDPAGKIVSLSQTRKGQPSLRGNDLLKSLDKLLPR